MAIRKLQSLDANATDAVTLSLTAMTTYGRSSDSSYSNPHRIISFHNESTMSSALTEFMAENYAKAVSIDLADWLELNPTPSFCEPKQDGFRVFLFKSHEKILLTTRHGVIYSESTHPRLFKRIEVLNDAEVPDRLVLDGEYISPDELHIFDVLRVGEEDLTGQPLTKRKKILSELLSGQREFLEVSSELKNSFQEIMEYEEQQLVSGKRRDNRQKSIINIRSEKFLAQTEKA